MLCVHFQGDSGGPLMCKKGNKYILAGAVSGGNPCFAQKDNNRSMPVVYARITHATSWILATIADNTDTPIE